MTLTPFVLSGAVISLLVALTLFVTVQWRAAEREARVEAQYPPSGQLIPVDGVNIHLRISGQGSDIVLIHGASGSLRDFTYDLVKRLENDFRVIAVDRPGMGHSDRPKGYGGIWNTAAEPPRLQAQILQAATDVAGVQNPILVGHSYGGAIALAWALERPETTAGLVLLASASNPWEGDLGWLYRINSTVLGSAIVIPIITAFTPHSKIETALSEVFAPQKPPADYMPHFGPDMTLRRSALRANAQQVVALKPHVREMTSQYPALTLPVEIVHGALDDTVPFFTHAEPLSRQLPDAVLNRLEGVGHMPHHANPEEVLAAIRRVATRAHLR